MGTEDVITDGIIKAGYRMLEWQKAFEKIDLPQAIAKLARHVGLDTKPIFRKPVLQVRGGAILYG